MEKKKNNEKHWRNPGRQWTIAETSRGKDNEEPGKFNEKQKQTMKKQWNIMKNSEREEKTMKPN